MTSILAKAVAVWAACSFLTGCGLQTGSKLPPGELGRSYKATISGTWTEEISTGGMECRMYKTYLPDGNARGVLLITSNRPGVSFVMPEIPFTSRWRVVGDVAETYDIRTGVPGLFEPGKVIRNPLVSVSQHRIVTRSESGQILILHRVRSAR